MEAVKELENHQKVLAGTFCSDEETGDEMNEIPNNFNEV